jgi:hypothetical protein
MPRQCLEALAGIRCRRQFGENVKRLVQAGDPDGGHGE